MTFPKEKSDPGKNSCNVTRVQYLRILDKSTDNQKRHTLILFQITVNVDPPVQLEDVPVSKH